MDQQFIHKDHERLRQCDATSNAVVLLTVLGPTNYYAAPALYVAEYDHSSTFTNPSFGGAVLANNMTNLSGFSFQNNFIYAPGAA